MQLFGWNKENKTLLGWNNLALIKNPESSVLPFYHISVWMYMYVGYSTSWQDMASASPCRVYILILYNNYVCCRYVIHNH